MSDKKVKVCATCGKVLMFSPSVYDMDIEEGNSPAGWYCPVCDY